MIYKMHARDPVHLVNPVKNHVAYIRHKFGYFKLTARQTFQFLN